MALIRATSGSGGGGSAKIPFTLQAISNRVIFSSQNCYVYDDNGTVKVHYEFTCKGYGSGTSGSVIMGLVRAKVRTQQTQGIPSGSGWSIQAVTYGTGCEAYVGNWNNGTVYSINEDVVCDWND